MLKCHNRVLQLNLHIESAREDMRIVTVTIDINVKLELLNKIFFFVVVSLINRSNKFGIFLVCLGCAKPLRLLESLELLSTPGVLKGVREAKEDIKAGRTKSMKEIFGS